MQFDLISHVNNFTGFTSEVQEGHRIQSTSIDKLKLLLKSIGALVLSIYWPWQRCLFAQFCCSKKTGLISNRMGIFAGSIPWCVEVWGCVSSRHICERWTQKHKYWVENRHLLHCEVMICTFPQAEGAGIPNIQHSPEAFGKVCTHKRLKPQIHQIPSELWS